MKKKVISTVSAIVLSMLFVSPTFAIPLIGIDTDPFTPGRQTSLDVLIGNTFTVGVVVEGIEAPNPLAAFQFDIAFNSTLIDSLSVTSAGSLPAPVLGTTVLDPEVRRAETSLSFLGPFPSDNFLLASVTFKGIGLGISILDLNDTVLSNDLGLAISHTSSDGSVTVTPEPTTLILFGSGGLVGLAFRKKLKRIKT